MPGVLALIKEAQAGKLLREGALWPGICWAQMAHSEAGGPGQKLVRKIRGMRTQCSVGPSGKKSLLATDSPFKRQSHRPSREWLANVPVRYFLLVCLDPLHLMYE